MKIKSFIVPKERNELFEDKDNDELPQVEKIICIDNLPINVTVQEINY